MARLTGEQQRDALVEPKPTKSRNARWKKKSKTQAVPTTTMMAIKIKPATATVKTTTDERPPRSLPLVPYDTSSSDDDD